MKKSLLLGALCACMFGFTSAPAKAQNAPTAPAQIGAKSGYDLFLEACALLQVVGPNGSPSAAEKLAPDENLRRQRLAVARNAPALAKLRAALKAGIAVPVPNDPNFFDFRINASAREFARQLAQESDVRAADGDTMGAAQSSLDSLELGAQISHGVLIQSLVGVAISSIGRKYLANHSPALDAAQNRAVAARLDEISAQMPTLTEILRAEATYNKQSLPQILKEAATAEETAPTEAEPEDEFVKAEMQLKQLPPTQIEAAYQKVFDEAIARAALPYAVAARAEPIHSDIAYVDLNTSAVSGPMIRFILERDIVANRLLVAALRLHAAKLESGQYPETFDAGIDPFSPTFAPMIYRREADSYVLYSVGPDGKDEDGVEIQTLTTDYKTGVKSVTGVLRYDSTGDIVAPVL